MNAVVSCGGALAGMKPGKSMCFTMLGHTCYEVRYEQQRNGDWIIKADLVTGGGTDMWLSVRWDESGHKCSVPELSNIDPSTLTRPLKRVPLKK